MSNTTRIENIANEVMKEFIGLELLKRYKIKPEACQDKIQCLVTKHMNFDEARMNILLKTLTFKNMEDYDREYNRLRKLHENHKLKTSVTAAATARTSDKFEEAVIGITTPFIIIAQEGEIMDMAFTYAFLAGTPEAGRKYFPQINPAYLMPGSILDDARKEVLSILDEKGYRQEWEALVAERRTPPRPSENPAPNTP